MRAGLRRLRLGGLDLAALILLWALSASVEPGQLAPDTKLDLYVDPWGFMGRALHLWDPQVTYGLLQNQGYGYLFPMGPFFGVTSTVLPMWICQRLWWGLLLTTGYLGMRVLLRALGVATEGELGAVVATRIAVLASLAYAVAPRVVGTIGTISSETLPVVMAPWILAPLVLASRRVLTPRRAAAWSGVATLCCGGVNAAAVLYALVPAAIWIITRPRWWRSALSWWTLGAVVLSTAWWAGPLVLLGRYSPPFLDWIENARIVSAQVSLLDVARGTTHWLGRLASVRGAWWPAGFEIATSTVLILATTAIAAISLLGLSRRGLPHRGVLLLTLLIGVLALTLPHSGALDSPVVGAVQGALDGTLAPFRNVHKADLLVRLPLTVALGHGLAALAHWTPGGRRWPATAAWVVVAGLLVTLASPGLTKGVAVRGTFEAIPEHWVAAGAWLADHEAEGSALVVPSASFGEYTWGRPMDEPLRPLTTAAYAVRDSVPLTPAGTIRFLDEIEQRLQSGRSIGSAVSALRAAGTRYVLLRNDLDAYGSAQPPVAFARSALRDTPGVEVVAAFGRSLQNEAGVRVQPIEIYDLGAAAPVARVWPAAAVLAASGASEAIPTLADAGWSAPILFDGDATTALTPAERVETDSYRARERAFGGIRGRDFSGGLTAAEDEGVRDYRPWADERLRSVEVVRGLKDVTASGSLARDHGLLGLWPAYSPVAAVDGDPSTAWVSAYEAPATLRLTFEQPIDPGTVAITPWRDTQLFPDAVGLPTRISVRTSTGETTATLDLNVAAPTTVSIPAGPTTWLEIRILDTDRGTPDGAITGLTEVTIPGIRVDARVALAAPAQAARTAGIVLTTGAAPADGCVLGEGAACLRGQLRTPEESTLKRVLPAVTAGDYQLTGTVRVDPRDPPALLTRVPGVTLAVSSSASPVARFSATALSDGDPSTVWSPAPRDPAPTIRWLFDEPTSFSSMSLVSPKPWGQGDPVFAEVIIDGRAQTVPISPSGDLRVDPVAGRDVQVRIIRARGGVAASWVIRVSEIKLDGRSIEASEDALILPCGQGPVVVIDGEVVATSAVVPRVALDGRAIPWSACATVSLSGADQHTVDFHAPQGLEPATLVLRPSAQAGLVPSSVSADVHRVSPTAVDVTVAPAPGTHLLETTMNENPGWVATADGVVLEPVVIAGYRQAFVLPEGTSGTVQIRFAPDGAYRALLLTGGLLALLLVLTAAFPDRRRGPGPGRDDGPGPGPTPLLVLVGTTLVGGLVMGPVGAGLAVFCWLIVAALGRDSARRRHWIRAGIPLLLLAAGTFQALSSPLTVGPPWVEATVRILVASAFLLAVDPGIRSDRVDRPGRAQPNG